ncbi:primosomal protein N' [Campylobacter sp. 19-13652]|uniref:primosomal protein N' n=1 Tax=Campylobacter sp. 19-13652 TaxID=2840180 RepID=UPI001C77F5E2|nr:primosomal protein N' [Campylobacter sp. 19-13652]BCX79519.1 primosomal protein N' [Campylobacter sp. 19-13652]
MSNFYKVAILGRSLGLLTYHSDEEIAEFCEVIVPLQRSKVKGYVINKCEKPEFKTLAIQQVTGEFLLPHQIELAKFISYYYTAPIAISLGLFEPTNGSLALELTQKSIITPTLSQNQNEAFKFIKAHNSSLLFGDTGSGKSEIYISVIAEAIKDKKTALFLMPEISLTPQMSKRLKAHFGDSVAIWHSKVSPKNKQKILKGIQSGEIALVAGARSALFLPMPNLGLIIVDEEHDDSYKSATARPHYNARDLALYLSQKQDIQVVLGSATPSITSAAKLPTFRLKGTYHKSEKSYIFDDSETGLSQALLGEIAKSLAQKRQVIICVPTRANFKYLICKSCSNTIKCPFCAVGMSLYKNTNKLKCQYCGYTEAKPTTCSACGSNMIEAKKIGTEEIMQRLKEQFAGARIAKFDRDEITTQKKLESALKDFNEHKIDILVGTQMLSKGHDYHNVDLAVIAGIDELLNYPDFRARERTLALAMQVAGRAGRAGQGRVVVQTRQPEFFASYINDYDKFIADETIFRNPLYPPFARLLRIIITHKDSSLAENIMLECVKTTKAYEDIELIGYGKCAIEYIGGIYRFEILLRASSHQSLLSLARGCDKPNIDIDIDPINFS